MTMKVNIKDQYIDRFDDFISSLPKDAIKIDTIDEHSITKEQAKQKVQKAIKNISSNQGLDFDSAFHKVINS